MNRLISSDRAKAELVARLARRYQLRTKEITIGDQRFAITGVADPDQVLLEMERGIRASGSEQPRWQPYWAQSWESALAIAHALAPRDLNNRQVLDLGCGLGLAGTMAAARGAAVTLADAAQPSLLFARLNSWPWRARVQTKRVNWREDRLGRCFDLILGADIVYDVSDWNYLDAFWKAHLQPAGDVLLAEPSRDNADSLVEYLAGRGWKFELWRFPIANRLRPIRLLRLQLAQAGSQSAATWV